MIETSALGTSCRKLATKLAAALVSMGPMTKLPVVCCSSLDDWPNDWPDVGGGGGSKGLVLTGTDEVTTGAAAEAVAATRELPADPIGSITDLMMRSACAMPSWTRPVKLLGGG